MADIKMENQWGIMKREETKTGKVKVAAYIRVSTDMNDQENSYGTQERYFSQLLEQKQEWVSVGIYFDYGVSGTYGQKRIGFKRMLRHCREGKIDRIVCKSISRFARNTADFMEALDVLRETGVTIFFEKEGMDTENSVSNFIFTTLAAIAQEESRSISANIRWSNEKRYPRGDVQNRDIFGYRYADEYIVAESGYRYRAVEIVEKEAEVVRWIFRQVADGVAYKDIARELNCHHIPLRPSAYTKKRMRDSAKGQLNREIDEGWTSGHISYIIKNERYTGDVLAQKTYTEDYLTHRVRTNKGEVAQYLIRDHHPAIVSRELFDEVRKVREMNSHRYGNIGRETMPYGFSGRLICGECGRFYNVRNTKKNHIWFCPSTTRNNGKSICHNGKVYEEQIIRMFRKAILERFHLTEMSIVDHVQVEDIMKGKFGADVGSEIILSDQNSDFIRRMMIRMENLQQMDFMERDRAFMRRQIQAASVASEDSRRKVLLLENQKQMMENRKLVLHDSSITSAQIDQITGELKETQENLRENELKEEKLIKQMKYMEEYWEELEEGYEYRKGAIAWMRGLPKGKAGVMQFLKEVTDTYVKAFVLSIIIHDPLHYTVHWFDDTRTNVEMHTVIEDYRYTSAYFDGQVMQEKSYRRKA